VYRRFCVATVVQFCGECLVYRRFCVATVCTVIVGPFLCVDCLVWLRSVHFVWGVSGV